MSLLRRGAVLRLPIPIKRISEIHNEDWSNKSSYGTNHFYNKYLKDREPGIWYARIYNNEAPEYTGYSAIFINSVDGETATIYKRAGQAYTPTTSNSVSFTISQGATVTLWHIPVEVIV